MRQKAISENKTAQAQKYELQERQYLDLMNVMRDVTGRFGHGFSNLP